MAGFRKAKAEQAALKIGMYGPPGSGKTLTALLIAEGLSRHCGKRTAFVDTERGTDFYAMAVPERRVHPEAFDFDALYTRSITEVLKELRGLSPAEHGVIVLDSISHVWDACIGAYSGPKNRAGQIPLPAWTGIKKPYKDLMQFLLNSPMHVLILGRQASMFEEDESGQLQSAGLKMRAEKETEHEPHICIRMENVRSKAKGQKQGSGVITAFIEKDRSGILQGKMIQWPTFENLVAPILPLLGGTQARQATDDETATQDAESLAKAEREREAGSFRTREQFEARLKLAATLQEVEVIGKQITPAVKAAMLAGDVTLLRNAYLAALDRAKGSTPLPAKGDGEDAA